jgi:type II secretory pathway pseudopilin PulG
MILRQQQGAALMVMLVIMIMGTLAFIVGSLNGTALNNSRNKVTAEALAHAKDALIGYAITYSDTHAGQALAYLPCPDRNGTGGINGEGSAETCGSQNVSSVGRLPWRTLGLPPLRDGNGECLWYAVAGSYKNNPSSYNMMNWDNNGLFQILAASSVPLTGATPNSYAVAVVFAPGDTLSNQAQNRSPDGSAPICGGNYLASNYLDWDASIAANNATPSSVANAISQFFTFGATANINDQITFITRQDIWNAVKKRNDFGSFISNSLTSTATSACMAALPAPVTINFNNTPPTEASVISSVGNLKIGRVPKACLTFVLNNWQDHLLYARCTSGSCLSVNGNACHGVVIFSGERNASQTRMNNTDKNNWGNFLENTPAANNLTSFATGATTFSGASSYTSTSPSTDILACIP